MTVREIVEKYLGTYKEVSAGNLQVRKCPFCDREKGKFYIKEDTGVYICHSGSCGAKGTLPQLVKHLEEKLGVKIAEPKAIKKKKGDKVNLQFKKEDIGTLFNSSGDENPNAKETIEYINSRGISTKTARDMDVFYRKSDKSVIFAYKNLDGNLAGVKYRSIREKKFSQATGSQAYLWNLERATNKNVVITEGECFKGDVEVFTEKGFVKFEVLKDEKVLQVKDDFTGEFVKPLAKIKKQIDDNLITMRSSRNNWQHTSTKGHNIVVVKNGKIKKITAEKVSKGVTGKIPTTVNFNGAGTGLSKDEIALIIAVSADSKCELRKNGERYFHFNFKKQRKIDRILEILERLNIKYTCYKKEYGCTNINFKSSKIKKGLPEEWVYQMTLEERRFFIEEIVEWDGNRVPNRKQYEFSSKLLHENQIVQTIAHTCGYMSTIMKRKNGFGEWYKTSILLTKNSVSWQKEKYELEKYNGYVYCVAVPSGMILVRINGKITVTGNCDALALAEIGLMDRALSVPMGVGNLDWIDNCREFLESKEEIILAFDNDEAGEKALRKVSQRLQHLNIRKIDLGNYKDINDFFLFEGKDELLKVLENSKEIELQGLETFYEVGRYDINKLDRFPFGIDMLDRVTRGAKEGELIILAGENGSGKTMISKQFILNARSKGKKVLVVNGEIQNEIYKEDLFKQANGDNKLVKTEDILIRGEYDYRVSDENYQMINDWLNGYLYTMSDQEELTDKNVLSMIESSIIKNNVFFIVVDNLSVIYCDGENEAEAKGRFAVALKNLAKKHGVCILLVNHFTKGAKDRGKEGIKGSGIISDIADMVFISEREDNPDIEANGYLNVVKNRLNGKLQKISLYFNPIYKTLLDDPDQVLKFNWKEFNEVRLELENEDLPY